MSEIGAEKVHLEVDLDAPNNNVLQQMDAHASTNSKKAEEVPPKKRKTRRGKSKRKHPYIKNKVIKQPEAPHNNNQFLLEDHGLIEDLDENLKNADKDVSRTRDSSFSVDSDGEFYSSPDDEEFLIKDFVDHYESVQAERLLSMSKTQLIEEYQELENKVELLTKRLEKTDEEEEELDTKPELKREIDRLKVENERLRLENEALKSKLVSCSDSEDSETDSSDSCSSSTSSRSSSPLPDVDYTQSNGRTSPQTV